MEEITIKVPYGQLAAKWWGPRNVRPIVAIHGWQDNAGSFDTLIPLLPTHLSYLAIDMPGHGISSRLPNGMIYSASEDVYILNMVFKQFGWSKVSLIGHSNGSITCFIYAATFPNRVDMVIGLDHLKPRVLNPRYLNHLLPMLDDMLVADIRNQEESEPPAYAYEELVDKLNSQTLLSVSRQTAPLLLKRGIRPSKLHADKYFFTRDNRLKMYHFAFYSQEICLQMARNIVCPYLFIKALQATHMEPKAYLEETLEVMRTNPLFEMHNADGGHHVHLTDPAKVSTQVSNFCNKVRPDLVKPKL